MRAFYRAWSSLKSKTEKGVAMLKVMASLSKALNDSGLKGAWNQWVFQVQQKSFAKRCAAMLEIRNLRIHQDVTICALFRSWRQITVSKGRERALRLQHQQRSRRQQRQMLAMLLKTKGQMLQKFCFCSWHMLHSFQRKEGRDVKLNSMLLTIRKRCCHQIFYMWQCYVVNMHQAKAFEQRSLLTTAFGLWKEQGAEALKEEFNDLWLKAVLLAARPLKSEDLTRFRTSPPSA